MIQRKNDGSTTTAPYIPSAEPGKWRRTEPAFRPPDLPQWGRVIPFALTNVAAFRLPLPPRLGSDEYAAAVEEVRRLGARNGAARSAEQEEIAHFWSDFSYTETPPGHWNQIARTVANEKKLSLSETARLFALLNMAMADAGIVAWESKYFYNCWRPSTAIQKAEFDGNERPAANAKWESYLQSPPFPEYPSGHSAFSGAAAEVLARFFGTDSIEFTVTSDSMQGVTRKFTSFSAAADEIGRSRIYGGIHFAFSDSAGQVAGRAVGQFIVDNVSRKADSR